MGGRTSICCASGCWELHERCQPSLRILKLLCCTKSSGVPKIQGHVKVCHFSLCGSIVNTIRVSSWLALK